ncbi:hypothetical protein SSX86_002861 [Deinandra increscens subsp. villosa]|uniref:Uncharacterized protein n=1 Tax=Deinandra increscens subsp. villosa TaxID=3103831 RepID=A0AAP0DX89_9ASTR
MNPYSILSCDFTEQQWVDQVTKDFDHDDGSGSHDDLSDVPVCVFSVPKETSRFKPEAYVPLAIALGPYHHFETHLYQMERFKVAAVRAILSPDQVLSFESLVINRLVEKEPVIRACYHKYINLHGDTLAWIFAIDGLFLIGLFAYYLDISTLMPKKLLHDRVLCRDVMVLENQIPLYLLDEIWKDLRLSSTFRSLQDRNVEQRELIAMMRKFCEIREPPPVAVIRNMDNDDGIKTIAKEDNITENDLEEIIEMGLRLGMKGKADRPIEVIKNIPWEKISNLLGLKPSRPNKENVDDPPVVIEIDIPSASSLTKHAQISFEPINGGIKNTKFDINKATLHLPIITLDDYSEVMLRNLLAYEMATSSSTKQLARYVDLMSGIVDSEADARLLRDKGIIKGSMKDKEVANLFNGMNKSGFYMSRSNNTIEQLNEYYKNRPMIKIWRFVKRDLICSKKVATLVLTIFASLLMILYSFCEVYGCSRLSESK